MVFSDRSNHCETYQRSDAGDDRDASLNDIADLYIHGGTCRQQDIDPAPQLDEPELIVLFDLLTG
jgi:hypothetical protein